jgi:hypothetical protein
MRATSEVISMSCATYAENFTPMIKASEVDPVRRR